MDTSPDASDHNEQIAIGIMAGITCKKAFRALLQVLRLLLMQYETVLSFKNCAVISNYGIIYRTALHPRWLNTKWIIQVLLAGP